MTLKSPNKQWAWTIDASLYSFEGWSRSASKGKAYVTYARALRNDWTGRYDLRATKYRWTNGS